MIPMQTLRVALAERSYNIHISRWELSHSAGALAPLIKENRLFILTNPRLKRLHGKALQRVFARRFKLVWIVIPEGEKYKTLTTCEKILKLLSYHGATRQSMILALGGGVIGDIAGFVAAIYMRGIGFVQMPTTLLAQVDSSVGGKTGVDLPTGKNLAGAFHQPRAVFIHTGFLRTLPRREFLCGMAEVIKYGVIADARFFNFLASHRESISNGEDESLTRVIHRSCAIKASIVRRDEREQSLRAILNYGHTLAHAIETLTGFDKIKHGEAVAMGMVFAARLAVATGQMQDDSANAVTGLIEDYGLPVVWPKFSARKYLEAIGRDKKNTAKNIRFILPQKIGKVDIISVNPEDIVRCL